MILNPLHKKLLISSLFAISMAYLESAVVVYLRLNYYPEGFSFPLVEVPINIILTEIGREAATLVMLWAFAKLVSKNSREVFAYFAFNFGIWDIWYYIWLKVLLNWPASIMDWDVLFLIPLPWVGPILAPVIVSMALILTSYIILKSESIDKPIKMTKRDWILESTAGLIIICSFFTQLNVLESGNVPGNYPWWLFLCGFILGIIVFGNRILETNKAS